MKQSADDLFGAVFGKEGGPGADSVFVSLLDQSRSGSAPKNFGFFFGAGQVSSWPALRGRIGAASVTGPAVEIIQAAPINPPCVFGLQSSLVSIGAAGEEVRIPLAASGAGCVWSASSDVNWAQLYPSSGAGSAAVQCTVFPNFSGSSRTAILNISGQQLPEHSLIQLPRPMLVGIRQCALVRRAVYAQMFQFPLDRHQAVADLSQRFSLAQMAEHHRHKLTPAAKTARMTLGLMCFHCSLKVLTREQLKKLGENAAYSIQGGSLRWLNWVFVNSDST